MGVYHRNTDPAAIQPCGSAQWIGRGSCKLAAAPTGGARMAVSDLLVELDVILNSPTPEAIVRRVEALRDRLAALEVAK